MASGGRVVGITIEIGGDTGPLSSALKGVNKDIRDTGSQLRDINRLLKLDPTNMTLLGQKADVAKKELQALQEKEKTLKDADAQLKQELSEGKISTEQYQAYQRELIATQEKIKVVQKESSTVGQSLGAFGNSAKSLGENLTSAGKKMLPATVAIGGIGVAAVKTASDFETAMSQTAGALNIPMDKMGSLRDLAMKMGADTQFSASEAGNAMTELAKGGLSEADIKAGALKATMDLAASSGMELGDAANTVVQTMGAFGLSASQSTEAVNALAGAAAASSTDVEPLAQGLSQCAAQAHMAGWSIQDTTAVLGAFADAGVTGSDAGTSLKTMLQRLGAPTAKAAATMSDLGINVWDSSGHMKDASGVAQELQTKMSGLSDQQKQQAMQTIFGSDATRAATILMNDGSAGLEKYTKATNDQAAAQRLANAQMGPTQKAMEQLKGSLETAGIAIGNALLPMIQKFAGFIQDLANRFATLSPGMQQAILIIGGIVAAIGPVLIVAGTMIKAVGMIALAMSGQLIPAILGTTAAGTTMEVALAPVIGIIAAVVAAIIVVVLAIKNWGAISQWFGNLWTTICGGLQTAWQAVAGFFSAIPTWWQGLWSGVAALFSGIWQTILANPIVQAVVSTITALWQNLAATLSGIWTGIKTVASGVWELIKNVVLAPVLLLIDLVTGNFGKLGSDAEHIWNNIKDAAGTIWNGIKQVIGNVVGGIVNTVSIAFNGMKSVVTTIWNGISGTAASIFNGMLSFFSGIPGKLAGSARAMGSAIVNGLTSALQFIRDLPGNALQWGKDIIIGIVNGIKSAIGAVKKALEGVAENIRSFLHFSEPDVGPLKDFHTWPKDMMRGLADGIQSNLGYVTRAMQTLTGSMAGAVQRVSTTTSNVYPISLTLPVSVDGIAQGTGSIQLTAQQLRTLSSQRGGFKAATT